MEDGFWWRLKDVLKCIGYMFKSIFLDPVWIVDLFINFVSRRDYFHGNSYIFWVVM